MSRAGFPAADLLEAGGGASRRGDPFLKARGQFRDDAASGWIPGKVVQFGGVALVIVEFVAIGSVFTPLGVAVALGAQAVSVAELGERVKARAGGGID